MFCPNCGKEIPDGSGFCPECGGKIGGGAGNIGATFSNMMSQANATPGKMNFVGFGAALFIILGIFIPSFVISAEVGFGYKMSFSFNIFGTGAFGIIFGILYLAIIAAGVFFSYAKQDKFVLYAGIAAVAICLIYTILVIACGLSVHIMGQKVAGSDLREARSDGAYVGPTVGFFILWIGSLAMAFAGVAKKYIPALR